MGLTRPDLADPSGFVSEAIHQLVTMIREDSDMWRPILLPPSGAPAMVLERIEHDKEQIRELFARLVSEVASEKGGRPSTPSSTPTRSSRSPSTSAGCSSTSRTGSTPDGWRQPQTPCSPSSGVEGAGMLDV